MFGKRRLDHVFGPINCVTRFEIRNLDGEARRNWQRLSERFIEQREAGRSVDVHRLLPHQRGHCHQKSREPKCVVRVQVRDEQSHWLVKSDSSVHHLTLRSFATVEH